MNKYLLYIIAALFFIAPLSFGQTLTDPFTFSGEGNLQEPYDTGVGWAITSYNDGEWQIEVVKHATACVFDSTPFIISGYKTAYVHVANTTAAEVTGQIHHPATLATAVAGNDGVGGQTISFIAGMFGRSISSASNRGVAMPVFDSTSGFGLNPGRTTGSNNVGTTNSIAAVTGTQLYMPTLGIYKIPIEGMKWGKLRYNTGGVNGADVEAVTVWVKLVD